MSIEAPRSVNPNISAWAQRMGLVIENLYLSALTGNLPAIPQLQIPLQAILGPFEKVKTNPAKLDALRAEIVDYDTYSRKPKNQSVQQLLAYVNFPAHLVPHSETNYHESLTADYQWLLRKGHKKDLYTWLEHLLIISKIAANPQWVLPKNIDGRVFSNVVVPSPFSPIPIAEYDAIHVPPTSSGYFFDRYDLIEFKTRTGHEHRSSESTIGNESSSLAPHLIRQLLLSSLFVQCDEPQKIFTYPDWLILVFMRGTLSSFFDHIPLNGDLLRKQKVGSDLSNPLNLAIKQKEIYPPINHYSYQK